MTLRALCAALCILSLTGCERLNEIANQAKLNGRAIGAACRHSGRALEDCFQRSPRIPKADIYAGWKEMNEYMLTKKIEIVAPPPDKPKKAVATVEIGGSSEPAAEDKPVSAKENKPQ
jgi:hypothetical protein